MKAGFKDSHVRRFGVVKYKEPGKTTLPGFEDNPKLSGFFYLFVLGAAGGVGAAGAALLAAVPASFAGSAGFSPQPVINEPITSPNSTIRVDSLFIVRVTLTESKNLTSKKTPLFFEIFRTIAKDSQKQANASTKFNPCKAAK